MDVEIRPSIAAAGLDDVVIRVADALQKMLHMKVAKPIKATWDSVVDSQGSRLVVLALTGDEVPAVRDIYSPDELTDLYKMRERFDSLLNRFLSRQMRNQLDQWFEEAGQQPVARN